MNRTALKSYAPKARRDFIAAVTARAAKLGVTAKGSDPVGLEGDFAIIGGTPFPKKVAAQRELFERRIDARGFSEVMESVAYTWFNRLAAIRYMEIHGYFDHGYRVLSHPKGDPTPEILQHADQVELPGLKRASILALKLDGRKDEELFRTILTAQCNALHAAMPFLFERIDDETELLLPDNLLHTDSIVRQLVSGIDEDDWRQIEIIGWLYQYYIAEKHDDVISEVVKSEDIPAATQLFTPNWIVKYMVQNSLGAQWLATYPESPLRAKMEYYITPAVQPDEVKLELAGAISSELDPEKLTMIDPACGSGHIIVEGYDLLKDIYLERGYALRQIPRLILEKNLYGLDIDDRASQLAGFALLMKARADDRQILSPDNPPKLNVYSMQGSRDIDSKKLEEALQKGAKGRSDSKDLVAAADGLVETFRQAKTFGSLITIPEEVSSRLASLRQFLARKANDDMLGQADWDYAYQALMPLVEQAEVLSKLYDAVVANPPYMGSKYYCPELKNFIGKHYKESKGDLYASFIVRNLSLSVQGGRVGMITIPNWMFLLTYDDVRSSVLRQYSIASLMHNGRGIWGADFGSCSFVLLNNQNTKVRGTFRRLFNRQGEVLSNDEIRNNFFSATSHELDGEFFLALPGQPLAYWLSDRMRAVFREGVPLAEIAPARQGLATADNNRFVRAWHEVDFGTIGFGCSSLEEATSSNRKWFPYNKGGDFRKWYGNQEFVLNWQDNGQEIRTFKNAAGKIRSAVRNDTFYFQQSISWSDITSAATAFRDYPTGFIYDVTGMSAFAPSRDVKLKVLGFCNSKVASGLTRALNPTLHFQIGNYQSLPFISDAGVEDSCSSVAECVSLAKADWDYFETSWEFSTFPLLKSALKASNVQLSFGAWEALCASNIARMVHLEQDINRRFIDAYGLRAELDDSVPENEITLARADPADDMKRLLSYSVGCMMGRFSLAREGIVFAGGRAFRWTPKNLGRLRLTKTASFQCSTEIGLLVTLPIASLNSSRRLGIRRPSLRISGLSRRPSVSAPRRHR
ncbi:BREX-1 system adenine-specific DNA-methyltransferase PglX [Tardiphaga robiniae]|uniref:BREX-1 system adenine-specific DNA-methyltransferase PglX n=1 Tax=Tardiphaga robiniae TaxID=943830 RepID=UPI001AEDB45E|nr:BREX-1 system adenine-specific DNA-methyltransferase PglX [Tardiphaga robiniae]